MHDQKSSICPQVPKLGTVIEANEPGDQTVGIARTHINEDKATADSSGAGGVVQGSTAYEAEDAMHREVAQGCAGYGAEDAIRS